MFKDGNWLKNSSSEQHLLSRVPQHFSGHLASMSLEQNPYSSSDSCALSSLPASVNAMTENMRIKPNKAKSFAILCGSFDSH